MNVGASGRGKKKISPDLSNWSEGVDTTRFKVDRRLKCAVFPILFVYLIVALLVEILIALPCNVQPQD